MKKTLKQILEELNRNEYEMDDNALVLLPSFIVKENNDKVAKAYIIGFINGANARLSSIKAALNRLKEKDE